MDFLLHNAVADLPGPRFLVFYALVIAATLIGGAWLRRRQDVSRGLRPPAVPEQLDPFEVAYLRGGARDVATVVVFGLLQRGYLIATEPKGLARAKSPEAELHPVPGHPDPRHLSELERVVFGQFTAGQSLTQLFRSTTFLALVDKLCSGYDEKLRGEKLVLPSEVRRRSGRIMAPGAVLILGLGAYKFFVALSQGHYNVAFLVVFGLVGLFLLFLVCGRPLPRLSWRGRAYLERLQLALERLRTRAAQMPGEVADGTWQLLSALYGVNVLAGTAYAFYPTLVRQATPAPVASSGGSCGSSCSSGSCSSGSSCGGGCGGGGCGGCGG